jgi:hypothetical protein
MAVRSSREVREDAVAVSNAYEPISTCCESNRVVAAMELLWWELYTRGELRRVRIQPAKPRHGL